MDDSFSFTWILHRIQKKSRNENTVLNDLINLIFQHCQLGILIRSFTFNILIWFDLIQLEQCLVGCSRKKNNNQKIQKVFLLTKICIDFCIFITDYHCSCLILIRKIERHLRNVSGYKFQQQQQQKTFKAKFSMKWNSIETNIHTIHTILYNKFILSSWRLVIIVVVFAYFGYFDYGWSKNERNLLHCVNILCVCVSSQTNWQKFHVCFVCVYYLSNIYITSNQPTMSFQWFFSVNNNNNIGLFQIARIFWILDSGFCIFFIISFSFVLFLFIWDFSPIVTHLYK